MLTIVTLSLLICSTSSRFVLQSNQIEDDLKECVINITKKYYSKGDEITYFDINSGDDKVLQAVNNVIHVSILSSTYLKRAKRIVKNEGYIIFVGQAKDLIEKFIYLTQEPHWNPSARFLILIKSIDRKLEDIFDLLLKFHVIDAVVLNGTSDYGLYTYNPFENYACGKRFDRIIHYGKCRDTTATDLFPNKLITGLRNCTFNVAASHFPPYAIDPHRNISELTGIEEYMLNVISEIEHFTINYIYSDDAEDFPTVKEDMSAVGGLGLLQNNKVDIIIGGMMLLQSRAEAFNYIYTHLAYTDDFRFLVKKSKDVSVWKNVYLEFQPVVWMLLLLTFVVYSIFFFALFPVKDRNSIMLKMWDSLFQHGYVIRGRFVMRGFFIVWIWFAYLVNSYYQSSLVSLSTHPAHEYQISTEADLHTFNLKPCISPVVLSFMLVEGMPLYDNMNTECNSYMRSIELVGQEDGMFTIIMNNIYLYNKYNFFDEWGESFVYSFSRPLSKMIYGVYFYKGFPMQDRLQSLTLRLRENGLLKKKTHDLYYEQTIKHYFRQKPLQWFIIIPWYIFTFGVCLSVAVFALELIVVTNRPKRNTSEIDESEIPMQTCLLHCQVVIYESQSGIPGHVLTPDLKDDEDFDRERRALSVRANMLARRFARCSREVKITLFRAFCTNFYTCSLWARYTQKAYSALRIQYNNAFRCRNAHFKFI
ncbi:uncharacterized protein ACR2FA_007508 [Aphomia sociella]